MTPPADPERPRPETVASELRRADEEVRGDDLSGGPDDVQRAEQAVQDELRRHDEALAQDSDE